MPLIFDRSLTIFCSAFPFLPNIHQRVQLFIVMPNLLESYQNQHNAGVDQLSMYYSRVLYWDNWLSQFPVQIRNWDRCMPDLSNTGGSQHGGKSGLERMVEQEKSEEESKNEQEGERKQEDERDQESVCQRLRDVIDQLSTNFMKEHGTFRIYINQMTMADLRTKLNLDSNSGRILTEKWNPKTCANFLVTIRRKNKTNPAIFVDILDCLLKLNETYLPSVLKAGQAMILVIKGKITEAASYLGVKKKQEFEKSTRLNKNR